MLFVRFFRVPVPVSLNDLRTHKGGGRFFAMKECDDYRQGQPGMETKRRLLFVVILCRIAFLHRVDFRYARAGDGLRGPIRQATC